MKLTKKEYFERIEAICAEYPEIVAFCKHERELLDKKNSSKGQTKVQKENESLKVAIVESLRAIGTPVTISEFQASDETMAQYSNQKLSALFSQLVKTEKIVKTVDKKKSCFSIAE